MDVRAALVLVLRPRRAAGPDHPAVRAVLAPPVAAGTRVRLGGTGRFAGAVGIVEARQRTR